MCGGRIESGLWLELGVKRISLGGGGGGRD